MYRIMHRFREWEQENSFQVDGPIHQIETLPASEKEEKE
jgi:hypothetical protein